MYLNQNAFWRSFNLAYHIDITVVLQVINVNLI